jgi:hypothetical protein
MVLYLTNALSNHHQIIKSSANVIIIYGDVEFLQGLMSNLGDISTIGKVWVLHSQWDVNVRHKYLTLDSFHGPLTFSTISWRNSWQQKFFQDH